MELTIQDMLMWQRKNLIRNYRELGPSFANLNRAVAGEDAYLNPEYALDDIHFSQAGYEHVLDLMEPLL